MFTSCLFKVNFNLKFLLFKDVEEIKIGKEEATVNYKINRRVTPIKGICIGHGESFIIRGKSNKEDRKKETGERNIFTKVLGKKTLKNAIRIHTKIG